MESRFENRSSESLKTAQKLKQGSNGSIKKEGETDADRANRIAQDYRYNEKPVFKDSQDVLKFQKEWNTKSPKDRITEDGILGEQTQVRYIETRRREENKKREQEEMRTRIADREEAGNSISEFARFIPDEARIKHYTESITLFKKQVQDINAKYQDVAGIIHFVHRWKYPMYQIRKKYHSIFLKYVVK